MFFKTKIAYAATVEEIIETVLSDVVNPFILLLMAVATVIMIYGIIELITSADNQNARKKGVQHMIWGIIGLTIMISAAGFLWILIGFWESVE